MPQKPQPRKRRASGLARYAFAWVGVGAALVIAIGSLIRAFGEEEVPLPPVHALGVDDAAAKAGCALRRARRGELLNPPVDGPPSTERVVTGVFDRPLPPATLGTAVRQGIVVIHHRPDVGRRVITALGDLQRAVPEGTIVSVNEALRRSAVAVTAYRRLLECPRYSPATVDAIRLFRGRFIGSGPDGPAAAP